MTDARALVSLLLLAAIFTIILALKAHGAEVGITVCSFGRMNDRAHWAWREIDGRRCWYRGEPGRSKALLRWSVTFPALQRGGRPEVAENPPQFSPDLGADPIEPKSILTEEIRPTWQATAEDQMKAFTCCWPEPKQDSLPPMPIVIPRATPPSPTFWPYTLLPVIVIAASVLLAKRRLT
jgi:hypothetical protein